VKGVKELKARIKSVASIRKVTSTMELVAGAKMRKLQDRALQGRPYRFAVRDMVDRVSGRISDATFALLVEPADVPKQLVIVVGADRGLCGAFNANLARAAWNHVKDLRAKGVDVAVYAIGKRVERFFAKVGVPIAAAVEEAVERVDYRRSAALARSVMREFIEGKYQRVSLVYTWFKSPTTFEPRVESLLPIPRVETPADAKVEDLDYIMEPSPVAILERLLPKSVEIKLYAAVLESLASEFASRRIAMKNATDAADDMTVDLTMEYNKARQSGITAELLEIVAGAAALTG
jgi:F-type H+-transporting ATPase subunit gamma